MGAAIGSTLKCRRLAASPRMGGYFAGGSTMENGRKNAGKISLSFSPLGNENHPGLGLGFRCLLVGFNQDRKCFTWACFCNLMSLVLHIY